MNLPEVEFLVIKLIRDSFLEAGENSSLSVLVYSLLKHLITYPVLKDGNSNYLIYQLVYYIFLMLKEQMCFRIIRSFKTNCV